MSSETRSSLRASERRRQRVVVAGVGGVAVLTAGVIAYWPGASPGEGAAVAGSTVALPGSSATGTVTDRGWDPTAATTTPTATDSPLTDATRSSRGETRPSLTPTGPATGSNQTGTPAGPSSAATTVPAPPPSSGPRPGAGHGGAKPKPSSTDTDPTTTGTPTPTSSPTSSTPTPTPSPSPTKTKNRCIVFLLC